MSDDGRRTGLALTAAFVVTAILLLLPFTMPGRAEPLKDRHSNPRPQVTETTVAVTTAGNLYHDPRCTFIHGAPVLETISAAIADGLSPCPRCLGALRSLGSRPKGRNLRP